MTFLIVLPLQLFSVVGDDIERDDVNALIRYVDKVVTIRAH